MKKFKQFLITSESDDSYFIINSSPVILSYLAVLSSEVNMEVANIFVSVIADEEFRKNKIFVKKDSLIGKCLQQLINHNKLVDESQIMREAYIVNTLFSSFLNKDRDKEDYMNVAFKLNDEKQFKSILLLENEYNPIVLEKINKIGRIFNYPNELELTGFETMGLIYNSGNWHYFDVTNKIEVIEEKVNVKIKNRENINKINLS